jgi:hypothetical protein
MVTCSHPCSPLAPPAPFPTPLSRPPLLQLVEGATFLEHFGRTYPDLFVQRCSICNGAGCMTCPHCGGRKDRAAAARAQLGRLSSSSAAAAAMALASKGNQECQHCGPYCDWDEESEWQEK